METQTHEITNPTEFLPLNTSTPLPLSRSAKNKTCQDHIGHLMKALQKQLKENKIELTPSHTEYLCKKKPASI